MIFADKLILLRKKAGWSQEELADQMNVTWQSVWHNKAICGKICRNDAFAGYQL